jgi:hypothetical protein
VRCKLSAESKLATGWRLSLPTSASGKMALNQCEQSWTAHSVPLHLQAFFFHAYVAPAPSSSSPDVGVVALRQQAHNLGALLGR